MPSGAPKFRSERKGARGQVMAFYAAFTLFNKFDKKRSGSADLSGTVELPDVSVIGRPCPAVFEENFLSVTMSLRTLCTRSVTKTTFELSTFLKRLRILNKGRKLFRENWGISNRNTELFKDRVRPFH